MEILPNELLIECLNYLDALHIFHSFDELNSRFSKLIRDIPLYIDFRHISISKYHQICTKLLLEPDIKKQIYSLKLTNDNIYQQQIVKSASQIDGFIHLRSLSFIDIYGDTKPQMNIDFLTLPQLVSFHMIDSFHNRYEILCTLPMSQMQNLTIPVFNSSDYPINTLTSITNLTISRCSFTDLHYILTYTTNLKYFHVNHLGTCMLFNVNDKIDNLIKNYPLNSLKQLTIDSYNDEFVILAQILKRTPCLITLTLINYEDEKLFNVSEWQNLIRSSLTKLKFFNFTCEYSQFTEHSQIENIFQQLQTDFWLQEHQWFTDCILSNHFSTIYTIPYPCTSYTLPFFPETHFNRTIDRQNIFNKVKHLQIHLSPSICRYSYYFPYLTSINISQFCLNEKYFNLLKTIVNLSNVNELTIASTCELTKSSILLDILKQASNLSILSIQSDMLLVLLDNDQLCEYCSKMIKKLTLLTNENYEDLEMYGYEFDSNFTDDLIANLYEKNRLWKTFENIETLECTIKNRESIRFILEYLPKLSHVNMTLRTGDCPTDLVPFAEQIALKLNMKISAQIVLETGICLSIWIHR